jgi:hypothetical protein
MAGIMARAVKMPAANFVKGIVLFTEQVSTFADWYRRLFRRTWLNAASPTTQYVWQSLKEIDLKLITFISKPFLFEK